MFTNTAMFSVGQYLDGPYLNAAARDNVNALYAQTSTTSLLNPLISGIISYTTNFDPTPPFIGDPLKVGMVGIETSLDSTNPRSDIKYRVAVTYSLATNSISGSQLRIYKKSIGGMGRPYVADEFPELIFTGASRTTAGNYMEFSSWKGLLSIEDEIWQIHVDASSGDEPQATYSNLGICFQVRTT